jgi:hypothetical protein
VPDLFANCADKSQNRSRCDNYIRGGFNLDGPIRRGLKFMSLRKEPRAQIGVCQIYSRENCVEIYWWFALCVSACLMPSHIISKFIYRGIQSLDNSLSVCEELEATVSSGESVSESSLP